MMKVIFLDIDGVLNSHSFLRTNTSALFDPDKIKILKKVVRETEAELILHSTLKDHFKSDMTPVTAPACELTDMLFEEGMFLIDKTDEDADPETGIRIWLEKNHVNSYCIIDDETSLFRAEAGHLAAPPKNQGLNEECAQKAIYILRGQKL